MFVSSSTNGCAPWAAAIKTFGGATQSALEFAAEGAKIKYPRRSANDALVNFVSTRSELHLAFGSALGHRLRCALAPALAQKLATYALRMLCHPRSESKMPCMVDAASP